MCCPSQQRRQNFWEVALSHVLVYCGCYGHQSIAYPPSPPLSTNLLTPHSLSLPSFIIRFLPAFPDNLFFHYSLYNYLPTHLAITPSFICFSMLTCFTTILICHSLVHNHIYSYTFLSVLFYHSPHRHSITPTHFVSLLLVALS